MMVPHRGWRSPPGPAVLMGTGHHHPNRSPSEISFFRTHLQTLPQNGRMAQISFSGTLRTGTFCLIELRKTPGCPQRDSLADPPEALPGPDLTGGEEVLKHKGTLPPHLRQTMERDNSFTATCKDLKILSKLPKKNASHAHRQGTPILRKMLT